MSKTGQWVFEMQEDAYDMTLEEFVEKHGQTAQSIWYETQEQADNSMEMDDGAQVQTKLFQT